jgi:hypothetical protein
MSRERDRFLAGVAHDLRQPISLIDMAARLLSEAQLDEDAQGLVERILSATAQLRELTSELLDLGAAGALELGRERMDLEPLVSNVSRNLLLTNPGRTIAIEFETGLAGHWDRRRITRIVQNLLENALSHSAGEVRIVCSRHGEWASLRVENPTAEIDEARLSQLFQPFARGDLRGRAGLGLYIARELARAHGGDVTAAWSDGIIAFDLRLPEALSEHVGVYDHPRRHQRAALETRLEVIAGERTFWVTGRDISRRGIGFITDAPLSVSERIQVAVYSEAASFSVLGTVRHVQRMQSEAVVGVEFATDLSQAEIDVLKKPRPS